ncbi:MAG: tetraacyldisaccharide 4'-kinase [Deltaproteobacteria bacterium]|nr:tetraacyldisaccharide 4'-kinase [Deltaproteobacteria bacterium]
MVAPWRWGLAPLAGLYAGAAFARREAYLRAWVSSVRLPVPVLSIGAITMGGSGKTPVARLVAEFFLARGVRVAVVTGSCGVRFRARPQVVAAAGPSGAASARELGDEAALFARWLATPAIVSSGANKREAAALAVGAGAEVVILDDGLQHCGLRRDVDVVVSSPDENRAPLPMGWGREWRPRRLVRPLRWWHQRDGRSVPPRPDAEVVTRSRATVLARPDGEVLAPAAELRGLRVALVAGVARPRHFETLVRDLGAEVLHTSWVRDHQPLTRRALRAAARCRPDLVLCTEKDAVRMHGSPEARHLVSLCCEAELVRGAAALEALVGQLPELRANVLGEAG